jgi:glycosyltransferase involved in cell wall biosynthesis
MLVKNSFEYDARVTKEARTLIGDGHDVTVVALHVPGVTAKSERRPDDIRVERVDRIYGRLATRLPGFLGSSTTTPGASTASRGSVGQPSSGHQGAGSNRAATRLRRRLRPAVRRLVRFAAWPLHRVNDRVVGRRMLAVAVAERPAVVHAHDLNTLAIGVRAAARTGAGLVYDAHELHTARNDATPVSRALARLSEGRGVRRADATITATPTWAEDMARAYGIAVPTVVRNVPPRAAAIAPVDLRTRLDLPADATVLLYQGSIQTNRGIEQTIDALPHLGGCALVVCGYGAHRPVLEEQVAARGLTERVRFDGPIPNEELIAYSAGADIGLCLIIGSSRSYRTSLPNKLFEYLMAGVPVVASDFPEMGAVVRRTGAGEVCDPADPAAIAAAVERLRDPDRHAEAAACARTAAEELNWEAEQQQLLAVYRGLTP